MTDTYMPSGADRLWVAGVEMTLLTAISIDEMTKVFEEISVLDDNYGRTVEIKDRLAGSFERLFRDQETTAEVDALDNIALNIGYNSWDVSTQAFALVSQDLSDEVGGLRNQTIEDYQVNTSGSAIQFDDDPGTTIPVTIRGDTITTLKLKIDAETLSAGEGIAITNDLNGTTVYIQVADISTGSWVDYTLYTAKAAGSATTLSTIATAASNPVIGNTITLTLKATAAETVDLDGDGANHAYSAVQTTAGRIDMELRILNSGGSGTKLVMRKVSFMVDGLPTSPETTIREGGRWEAQEYAITSI